MDKRTILLNDSVTRSGKTREILTDIINGGKDLWVNNVDIPKYFVVNKVGDVDIESTVSNTINIIRGIDEKCKCVIIVGNRKICSKLIELDEKAKIDNIEIDDIDIMLECKRCSNKHNISSHEIDSIVENYKASIFSFNELIRLSKEGYCPKDFSFRYAKKCEIVVMGKTKIEYMIKYREDVSDIFPKNKYILIYDEAHGLLEFNHIDGIFVENKKEMGEQIRQFFNYDKIAKYCDYNFNNNVGKLIKEQCNKEIENVINIVNYSLDKLNKNCITDEYIIKQNYQFTKNVEIINNLIKQDNRENIIFSNNINKLNSINRYCVITDVQQNKKIDIIFYEVSNDKGKIKIENKARDLLLSNAKHIMFITATPIEKKFYNLWFGDKFKIVHTKKTIFDGKFTLFYHLVGYRVGVINTHVERKSKTEKAIKGFNDEFPNNLYIVVRGTSEFYDYDNYVKKFDTYIGSNQSEGLQRNEQLLLLLGIGLIPSDGYKQSSILFKNTIGIYTNGIREDYINMLSMQRTIQSMFRNADKRKVDRGCFILNCVIEDINNLKSYSIGEEKGIEFVNINDLKNGIEESEYGIYARKYLEGNNDNKSSV